MSPPHKVPVQCPDVSLAVLFRRADAEAKIHFPVGPDSDDDGGEGRGGLSTFDVPYF